MNEIRKPEVHLVKTRVFLYLLEHTLNSKYIHCKKTDFQWKSSTPSWGHTYLYTSDN